MRLIPSLIPFVLAASACAETEWEKLWKPNGKPLPDSNPVMTFSLGGLGSDLEGREWQMVSSRYHTIYFRETADKVKVQAVYQLIDNVYDFLSAITPVKELAPIQIYLVTGEVGNARRAGGINAIRTGLDAELSVVIATILHEETYLFNRALLATSRSGWWASEFMAFYFQTRALQQLSGGDVREFVRKTAPQGLTVTISMLEQIGEPALATAWSVLYFLEETYGRNRLAAFRRAALKSADATRGGPLPDKEFEREFGESVAAIDRKWRLFYGWPETPPAPKPAAKPAAAEEIPPHVRQALEKPVSYSPRKTTLLNAVRTLATQAGLGIDEGKSVTGLEEILLTDLAIQQVPLRTALNQVLNDRGFAFRIEKEAIVLVRK